MNKFSLSRLFSPISNNLFHLWLFLKNCCVFRKELSQTYNFDYGGSLHFLRKHLEILEPVIRNGYNVNREGVAKNILTCRLLLDRLLGSTHQYTLYDIDFDMTGGKFKLIRNPINTEHPRCGTKLYYEIENNKEKNDWQLLMKLLTKHQRSFWD